LSPLAPAIIAAVVLSGLLGIYLMYRQAAAVVAHRDQVPLDFAGQVSLEEHRRAADYTLARTRLEMAETAFDTVFAVLWLTVLLGPVYEWAARFLSPGLSRSVAIVAIFGLILRIVNLPFSIFSTFALEARFGFNRVTPAMFMLDRIKGLTLQAIIGIPALYGLFWLLQTMPHVWWLAGWAALMAMMIAMILIYPAFIAPLFNKFTPLADGSMKASIEALLAKCGFESNGLYVMDASKRSTHGNAYFTGFGKAKRIVFFDTLLEKHSSDEVLSILAHELGHYKLGHIGQRIAQSAVLAFVAFAILGWAFGAGGLASAFGLAEDPGVVLIIILTAIGPILHLLSPLTSWLSRRAEFQADNFAKSIVGEQPMINALTRLTRDNLSTLTPDSLYALFYYSHPPVPLRIAQLKT
jgi:STE24 endopeptidase